MLKLNFQYRYVVCSALILRPYVKPNFADHQIETNFKPNKNEMGKRTS